METRRRLREEGSEDIPCGVRLPCPKTENAADHRMLNEGSLDRGDVSPICSSQPPGPSSSFLTTTAPPSPPPTTTGLNCSKTSSTSYTSSHHHNDSEIITTSPSTRTTTTLNAFTSEPYRSPYFRLLQDRKQLPIFAHLDRIRKVVKENPITIIVGETGSGKTTQIPPGLALMFLEEDQERKTTLGSPSTISSSTGGAGGLSPLGSSSLSCGDGGGSSALLPPPQLVCCTQPRRIAALSVASRVAEEQDVVLGEEVGYHVRFQPKMNPHKTRVLYMTDGLLLRECVSDPHLARVRAVVVDEVHERTKSTDVALGLLKQVVALRSEFRLVVMSATLDVSKLRHFFPGAPLLPISGRLYPVDVYYSPSPVSDYVKEAVQTALRLHFGKPEGDILCFLTGEKEILQAIHQTKHALLSSGWVVGEATAEENHFIAPSEWRSPSSASASTASSCITEAVVLPLYGAQSLADQRKVFTPYPSGTRKIVYCTNIAETSVTVDGVVYVIDCGYQKQTLYHANVRVEYLLPAVISKASAEQRRGRAGRTRSGCCYRLVTEKEFENFPPQSYPEVLCSSVVDIVLLLLEVGVLNPLAFDFVDPPSEESLNDAFFQLLLYGIVNEELQLTPLGKQVAAFPVDMRAARMLVRSAAYGCTADVTALVAMGEGGNVFRGGGHKNISHQYGGGGGVVSFFARPEGDHFSDFFVFHEVLQRHKSEAFCEANGIRTQSMYMVYQVYDQLREQMRRLAIPFVSTFRGPRPGQVEESTLDVDAIRKALLEGYFLQVALLISPEEKRYRTVCDGLNVCIHPQSILLQPRLCSPPSNENDISSTSPTPHVRGSTRSASPTLPRWVMYDRLEVQAEDGTVLMRRVTEIDVKWLFDVSEYYRVGTDIADRDIAFALEHERQQYVASH